MSETYSLAPGSPPRTPASNAARTLRPKSVLPRPLSFDKSRPFQVGDGPMSAPISYMHSQGQYQLDADTVAIAQAAAAAAYNEAIANMTAARNGVTTLGNSSNGYYQQHDQINSLSSSPPRGHHHRPLSGGSSSLIPMSANSIYQDISSTSTKLSPTTSYFPGRTGDNSNKNPAARSPPSAAASLAQHWDNPPNPLFSSMSSVESSVDNSQLQRSESSTQGSDGDPKESSSSPQAHPPSSPPDSSTKKMSLYKTELCRSWEESGNCRYGNKCQFAHSTGEVRNLDRHPKYKTEMCKTFWDRGACPYGKRCCFIHTLKGSEGAIMPTSGGNGARSPGMGGAQTTPTRQRANSGTKSPMQQYQCDPSPHKTPPQSLKPLTTSSPPTSESRQFEQVTSEFSLWSPSMNSPDISGGNAFSFSNSSIQQSTMRNKSSVTASNHAHSHSLSSLESSMGSFQISSPLNTAGQNSTAPHSAKPSSLLLLNTGVLHSHFGSGSNRSTLSAGIPPPQPFFAPDPFDDDEIPLSAPATRFHNSGNGLLPAPGLASPGGAGGRTMTTRMSTSIQVPILATAPPSRTSNTIQHSMEFYSPLSTSFTSILDDEDDHLNSHGARSGSLLSPAGPSNRTFAHIMNGATIGTGALVGKREPTIIESTRQPIGRAGTLRKFDSGLSSTSHPSNSV